MNVHELKRIERQSKINGSVVMEGVPWLSNLEINDVISITYETNKKHLFFVCEINKRSRYARLTSTNGNEYVYRDSDQILSKFQINKVVSQELYLKDK